MLKTLLNNLLTINPKIRLDINQIKSHSFFESINWEDVSSKKIDSPLKYVFNNPDELKPAQFIPIMFEDQDYMNDSETLNRVRGFSFIKH